MPRQLPALPELPRQLPELPHSLPPRHSGRHWINCTVMGKSNWDTWGWWILKREQRNDFSYSLLQDTVRLDGLTEVTEVAVCYLPHMIPNMGCWDEQNKIIDLMTCESKQKINLKSIIRFGPTHFEGSAWPQWAFWCSRPSTFDLEWDTTQCSMEPAFLNHQHLILINSGRISSGYFWKGCCLLSWI